MAVSKEDTTRMILVAANVATCFEQPSNMLVSYMDELLKEVKEKEPGVFALHCQEVGGKNYLEPINTTMDNFAKVLISRPELEHYTRSVVYLDGATTVAHQFTALGNLYFFHKDAGSVETWDFKDNKFIPLVGKQQFTGPIEDVSTKEKSKFPQEFFPECKWSRKGFMRTRWNINGTQLDLVNIHLFHDASNFLALDQCPSVFALNRQRTLKHTLDRFHNDSLPNIPFFMFGDFNFRLDAKSVIETLTKNCTSSTKNDDTPKKEVLYYAQNDDGDKQLELKMSKRFFKHTRHQDVFKKDGGEWLRKHDFESKAFAPYITEMPITFPMSYPYEEEPSEEHEKVEAGSYANTRIPAWCDRVMISTQARELLKKTEHIGITYQMLGHNTPMGDHKPVSLCHHIPHNFGALSCCKESEPCNMLIQNPELKMPCYVTDNKLDSPKPPKIQKTTQQSSTDVPTIKLSVKKEEQRKVSDTEHQCEHKGESLHDRRESLFSEGGCGGVQCSCVTGRRCSEASCLDTPDSKIGSMNKDISTGQESDSHTLSDNKSLDLSIKSVDSENILANNDTLSTLLNNRVRKYDIGGVMTSDNDCVSVTSSMRVEQDSVMGESEQDTTDHEQSLNRTENKSVECGSITSKTSKDLYSKLVTMRENKDDAQLSMNNLLASDSGSDQASLKHATPSNEIKDNKDMENISQTPTAELTHMDNNNKKKKTLSFRKKKKSKKSGDEAPSSDTSAAVVPARETSVKCCSIQ